MKFKDQSHMNMRGKRSKRQRQQSPFPFPVAADPLNEEDGFGAERPNRVVTMESFDSNFSRGFEDNHTKEEEETANSLILLAQGQLITREQKKASEKKSEENLDSEKTRSKRFLETALDDNGKPGCYVYECKTCNRTFPSFQALGGHRASHKKPKPNHAAKSDKTDKNMIEGYWVNHNSHFPLYLYSGNIPHNTSMNHSHKGSHKVHECGICGAEFNSGQALGGHMRRHRGVTSTVLSLTPKATESDNQDPFHKSRTVLSLDLDLNLPAPVVEGLELGSHFASKHGQQHEQQQTREQFQQQQQQHSLVFSSPKLVDCQY